MLTVDESRKLRDDKVFAELAKRLKPKKKKAKRKSESRPPDAKMSSVSVLPQPEKAKEAPKE